MKKISMMFAVLGGLFVGAASAANITIYYSPTCPHCHHARDFISSQLIYEYPNLTVTEVNVMSENTMDAFRGALQKCKYESGGVPVMVIGEKCFQGYADFMQQELRDAIEADLTEADKATAADNRQAMEKDSEGFKTSHADRGAAIVEYDATTVKKNDKGNVAYFYGFLLMVIAGLSAVALCRKKGKK